MKRLLLLVLLLASQACKPSAEEGAAKFCGRVKPGTPAAQEECRTHYLGLRGFAKECVDDCVTTAADGDAFEGCREACFGKSPSVQDVCLAVKRSDLGCVQHYVVLQKGQAKSYGCVARCVTRDKDEAACATTCNTPAPAPVMTNMPVIPP